MIKKIFSTVLIITALFSCDLFNTVFETETEEIVIVREVESIDTPDWTEETHSKSADLNYDIVFNQNEVLVFNISIDSDEWQNMQYDLYFNLGSSNIMGSPLGGGPGGDAPDMDDSALEEFDYDPIWVPSTVNFDGTDWYKVGIRFKGNSSLTSAYNSGNGKLSLKLDFDEFEDTYPDIENQRFYGFKQLNLNNNFDDESLMREKVGADLFREFGLVSSQTTFCAVYIDYGEGSQFFGVYTLVEEMDDTTIETQLSDDSGNLYKPDGDAASFASGTYDKDEMVKKNNEDEDDFSDVLSLYEAINNTESGTWQTELESAFNVDGFLKWLAANSVIQNWDTYGNMTHNYYLYNNHDTGLLNWIPWDNNESLQDGKMINYDLGYSSIDDSWPLIKSLLADADYKVIYEGYLQKFIDEVFITKDIQARYADYYDLIKSYAYAEESGYTYISSSSSFDDAVETLQEHVKERNLVVNEYFGN